MKTLRVVLLSLSALCLIVLVQPRAVVESPVSGQQGPPDAPPPTAMPSEPIILHSQPQHMPPDFEGPPKQTPLSRRFNAAATRKDAAQLASLASKIPDEVDQVSKGVLPKDLDRQLKEIQKLAKRLRGEVAP